jgi:membrane protein YdbS with pleckstrin-like domain
MGRFTIYAQNNPRQFGLRTALVSGAFVLLLLTAVFAPLLLAEGADPWSLGLFGVLVLMTLVMMTVGGFVSMWMMRRMVKGRPLPVDADPAKAWAAHWQIMRGTLHPDPETNRLGRILADQSDTSRSPKYMIALGGFLLLINVPNALLYYEGGSPMALFNLFFLFALLVTLVILVPITMRRQRRVRQFRETYDLAAAGSSGTLGRED